MAKIYVLLHPIVILTRRVGIVVNWGVVFSNNGCGGGECVYLYCSVVGC